MESEDYETQRNLTLMFFLEKLLDIKGGGSRSLHDLSCQFGTKGFSREMRQIAGGSQAGLKRFFKQFPSLFTVEGDMVSITVTHSSSKAGSGSDQASSGRDYIAEAVEYFESRLEQYGPGTEVPIKSLLGHRSQAPPEVRHVSGQHVKEFRDFLAKHSNTFVVREDDIIYLTKYQGCTTTRISDSPIDSTPKLDPQVTNELLSTIRTFLQDKDAVNGQGEMSVQELFEGLVAQEGLDQLLIKRQQDLITFLKMHSHLFKVTGGQVSLIPIPKEVCPAMTTVSNKSSPTVKVAEGSPQHSQQSLKQRVNNVVLKVLADNSDKDKASTTVQVVNDEAHRLSIYQRSRLIISHRESAQVLAEVIRRGEAVALDCEGINLSTPAKGQVTIVQLGLMSGQALILDVLTDPQIWEEGQLKAVLQCNHVVKVLHDCRNISSVLKVQHQVNICSVFDAQAAHAVLEMQENGKPIHKVKNESLNALCDFYGASANPIKDQLKTVYRKDPRFWARRPMAAEMVIYAASDVLCLVPDIYLAMKRAIKPEFVNLYQELCEEQVLANIDPEVVKSKKKQRKLDFEVSELRLKIATCQSSKNIVLSNREIRLLRHVELTEEDKDRLRGSYKVAKKLEKLENKQKDFSEDEDEDSDNNNDLELPSLESVYSASEEQDNVDGKEEVIINDSNSGSNSDFNSQPASLTDSMAMVNKILADGNLDRLERIERLEAILTDVTTLALSSRSSSSQHINTDHLVSTNGISNASSLYSKVDAETQTISTGDISITKIYSPTRSIVKTPDHDQ